MKAILLLFSTCLMFAQAPVLTYNGVQQVYPQGVGLFISPTNSGGQPSERTIISTYSGTSSATYSDGPVGSFSWVIATAISSDGTLYAIDDYFPSIRKILPNGATTTLAGKHVSDSNGVIQMGYNDGQGDDAEFNNPKGIAVDSNGDLYIADTYNGVIRKVTSAGLVSTYATGFTYPYSLCIDSSGSLYVIDLQSNPIASINSGVIIKKVTAGGIVTVVAGSVLSGNTDGAGSSARFNQSRGIAVDSSNNLYISDSKNNRIRRVDASGNVTTIATGLNYPVGIAIDSEDNIYVSNSGNNTIEKLPNNYAGSGFSANNDSNSIINGLGNVAMFNNPSGISVDNNKTLYVADRNTQRIRKVSLLKPYTISPNLPAGLVFNEYTGVISGTPTYLSPSTTYTITSSNYSGTSTASLSFRVSSCGMSTVWNGSSWSNGLPDATTDAIINGSNTVTSANSFTCCNLFVNSALTINSGYVEVVNDITVDPSASLIVNSGGKLIPKSDTSQCYGVVTVKRTTPLTKPYDYTYFASPVSTSIGSALPPVGWISSYIFKFETQNFFDVQTQIGTTITPGVDGQDDDGDAWVRVTQSDSFVKGKGYAAMVNTTSAVNRSVSFTGQLNTGVVTVPLVLSQNTSATDDDFNLIGNPYSASIFADDFINTNFNNISGTLYFWTHTGTLSQSYPGLAQLNFSPLDYAYYNLSGGVSASFGGRQPFDYIGSCQGFVVEAETTDDLIFRPSFMAPGYTNSTGSTFFRDGNRKRLWLSINTDLNLYSQQLIAYTSSTSNDYDKGYDFKQPTSRLAVKFYSFSDEEKYKIQSRGEFNKNDSVRLGYYSAVAETFTMSVDSFEGIGKAYIKDNGVIHNLPYTFSTDAGEFNDRFVLVYKKKIRISPNPSNKLIKVEGSVERPSLYSIDGNYIEVPTYRDECDFVINIESVKKGVYLIKVDGDVFKVIKK